MTAPIAAIETPAAWPPVNPVEERDLEVDAAAAAAPAGVDEDLDDDSPMAGTALAVAAVETVAGELLAGRDGDKLRVCVCPADVD